MPLSVSIIGTGPTGLYSFARLIEHPEPLTIWLFEKGDTAGVGMPYSPETASKAMLANIASIEIPPVVTTFLSWMETQPPAKLRGYGLDPGDLDARQFTPRLLIGEYYGDQMRMLVASALARGHSVEVAERAEVTDIARDGERLRLTVAGNVAVLPLFDRVIVATGHVFPDADEATRRYFPSPWSGLIDADVPAARVGILGTSLSGIDAAMAVAGQHGRFRPDGEGGLVYAGAPDSLKITLMSWTGILPEADFYCPIPYEPLAVMTEDAIAALRGAPDALDGVWALFRDEMIAADPAYASAIGIDGLSADDFADAYFAARLARDPFRWARANLAEVERNKADRRTVAWRYAILRMHEQVESLVEDFSATDRARFDKGLKKVFVDNYAAVPSESIRRLLALRDAGVLSILALGEDYALDHDAAGSTASLADGTAHRFDVFIDARGQKPMDSADIPFPTLRTALLDAGCAMPELDEDYCLLGVPFYAGRVWLGALPWLMHDRPFVQGITASAEIGAAMARDIRHDADTVTRMRRRRCWL